MALKSNSSDGRTRSSIQIFIVVGLCCFFYILGAWQRSGFGKGDSIALEISKSGADCNIVPSLNFETHHGGEVESINESESKPKVFEPCQPRYTDYTPCQDQRRAMTFPRESMNYRERHCPPEEEKLHCLIPAPKGYVTPFPWPKSRDYVPYANAPYKSLTVEKAIQNWIQYEGNVFRFPGGGTQFPQGADKYIDQLASVIPIKNGTVRTALDTGCGVASWGAYLWSRNVIAMSFAPRDSHEAQVQFALERGVPAVIGVLGTIKMPYPSRAFDMAHCSRCLIPWGANDGRYMIEVDRVLRPGGYWVLSGPPINWKTNYKAWQRPKEELQEEQRKIEEIANLLCWEKKSEKGEIAVWQKKVNDESCRARRDDSRANFCKSSDADDVWYKKMEGCITPYPEVAGGELKAFPERLYAIPPRISSGSIPGVSAESYQEDSNKWKKHANAYTGVSIKEIDSIMSLLSEKKRKMEQEEAERNMQILLDFLHCLRKQKVDELKEIQTDLHYIKEDINAVERHRIDLYRARDRYSVKLRMLGDDSNTRKSWLSSIDKNSSGIITSSLNARGGSSAGSLQNKKGDGKAQANSHGHQRKDSLTGSDSQCLNQSGLSVVRKKRVHAQFNDLQECYLQKRRQMANQPHIKQESDKNIIHREGYNAGLADFQSVLTTFTQYSRLRVIAELRHGDIFHSANIVSSIEFDRDDQLFATAGVSRRIKVFDFASVVNEPADVHCPVVEMPTRSKLSCLSWNKFSKNRIASSDYEGIVTVWDVTTQQSVMEYEEHEKRAWSVDFSRTEPSMLVSGSDDCKVKVWCTRQEASVLNIDMKANICCVKYNPGSSNYIAVGSADHHIHYYDLRNISQPLHVFTGHKKAVSYVKFLSNDELASASTDSTLRLWDVKENLPVRTFRGHMNEKNFVGLTVNSEYIACGSESNEVYVYHKEISKPVTWHRFSSPDMDDTDEDAGSYFISAVCWKSDSPTMLTANSQGTIKVLVLAA